jgi:hypothetical protein
MDLESQNTAQTSTESLEFAKPTPRKSLEILRDAEALLRRPTVAAIVPILPAKIRTRLEAANTVADNTLNQLAEIDVDQISDWELRPARIQVGLLKYTPPRVKFYTASSKILVPIYLVC